MLPRSVSCSLLDLRVSHHRQSQLDLGLMLGNILNPSKQTEAEAKEMRPKKRNFLKGAAFLVLLSALDFILTIYFIQQARLGLIDVNPGLIMVAGFFVLIVLGAVIAPTLIFFDTSWVTPRHRDLQPSEPPDDEYARVIIHEDSGHELFIYGKENDTVGEALLDNWPFSSSLKRKKWYVLDDYSNDVTDKALSTFEGTGHVFFKDASPREKPQQKQ